MTRAWMLTTIAMLFGAGSIASAGTCEPTQVGSLVGDANDVDVLDGLVAAALGNGGLALCAMEPGGEIGLLSRVETSSSVESVRMHGAYAYVVLNQGSGAPNAMTVIDISDPANPVLLEAAIASTNLFAIEIDHARGLLFVSGYPGEAEVSVIDLADPLGLVPLATFTTSALARDIEIKGTSVYVAAGDIEIVDLTNPALPAPISSVAATGSFVEIEVHPSLPLVAAADYVAETAFGKTDDAMRLIDVSSLAAPVEVGAFMSGVRWLDSNAGLAFRGDVVYASSALWMEPGDQGPISELFAINVSDSANPSLAGSVDIPRPTRGLRVLGDTLLVPCGLSGLHAIDIGGAGAMTATGDIALPNEVRDVYSNGANVFVSNNSLYGLIHVLEQSGQELEDVGVFGHYAQGSLVETYDALSCEGDYLFAGGIDSNRLHVFDVSDPSSPVYVTRTPVLEYNIVEHVYTQGDIAIVSAGRLRAASVVDISDPTAPVNLSDLFLAHDAMASAMHDGFAYICGRARGLYVYDLSSPAVPVYHGRIDVPGSARDIVIEHPYAYIASGVRGLQVVDISDPIAPALLGREQTTDNANRLVVRDGLAYVAQNDSHVSVINVTDPNNPEIIGGFDTPSDVRDVALVGNRLYVGTFGHGVRAFDVALCEQPADLNADGVVDSGDLAVLLAAWGAGGSAADLDGDGVVGAGDLAILLASWG